MTKSLIFWGTGKVLDHPIFLQSIQFIRKELNTTHLNSLEQQVLERLIHTSGDFGVENLLQFTPGACQLGLKALQEGAEIIVDTSMAREAIKPMIKRTINVPILNIIDWAPNEFHKGWTRTAIGMKRLCKHLELNSQEKIAPIFVIGSSPTALEVLLDCVSEGMKHPSLIIGMPVGFIGVQKSKERLCRSNIPSIILDGTRGGAALAASAVNALVRATYIQEINCT